MSNFSPIALRSLLAIAFASPPSVNTAGRRGVFLSGFTGYTRCAWLKKTECASWLLVASQPVKQYIYYYTTISIIIINIIILIFVLLLTSSLLLLYYLYIYICMYVLYMSSIHLQTSRSISQEKALRKFLGDRSISPKMSQRVPRCARCVGVSRVSRGGCWGWGYIYRFLDMGYMGYIINPYNPL